jgi:hypothetical protein
MPAPELHSSIIALVSLASGIASKHPDMGQCQLEKLRAMGIPEEQIATVIEIARHIRDEASLKLDAAFDERAGIALPHAAPEPEKPAISQLETETESSCCSSTSSGQRCC